MYIELTKLFAAIGGFAAFIAAFISWRALVNTKKLSEANLVLEFLKEYSSREMSDALRLLRKYQEINGKDFHKKWLASMRNNDDEASLVDKARRKVSHYFQRGHKLHENGYVSSNFISTSMLVDGLDIYLNINKPLEVALGANPDDDVFKFYESKSRKNIYVRRVFSKNA